MAVLINANGQVDASTALTGVYNGNNPRSVYSADRSSFYVSGQGTSGDTTGGVFYATRGSHTATAITGLDATGNTVAQDTRYVQVYNGQLLVSADSKQGSGNSRDFIGTLGAAGAPPTALANGGAGATQLSGFGGSKSGTLVVTAANGNGINPVGKTVNLSPEAFYFAAKDTLYVADSGVPKNTSGNSSTLGDGGLQKWSNSKADGSGTWTLDYTVAAGLNLVANTAAAGTTGLLSLTGKVLGNGQVELYATNYTAGDTDQTYLYGVSDTLSATSKAAGESFTMLAAAPADSNFKGLSFAPTSLAAVPEPSTVLMFGAGLAGLMLVRRRQQR
ncbi:PEP-CTERM sorting domain-containing protein [Rugamonas sp.]|uniref:PEP-CTERM sorting domain-containing protein n=1 Tax=Rugamonas sp. TaxID=1926287 RepID=UPI0025DD33BA|nr:PEP-CTERM sorting domain-containing protein [Rugamonas sp.]